MKVRVFTAFSGYDSQCLALERLKRDFPKFDYELVGWSEIDEYAIKAHNALFPEYSDISKTALMKMAGNSIVVDVLYYIFKQMLIEYDKKQIIENEQLTLF